MSIMYDSNISSCYLAWVSVCTTLVERAFIHPVETVYLTQQKEKIRFTGAMKLVYSRGGIFGYYSGLSPMLWSALPVNASLFGVYTKMVKHMQAKGYGYNVSNISAGITCGFSSSLLLSPVESIRLRKIYDMPAIKNIIEWNMRGDVAKHQYSPRLNIQSIRDYYCGYPYVLSRMILFGIITLSGSSMINRYVDPKNKHPMVPYVTTLGMGCLTTSVTTVVENVRIQHFVSRNGSTPKTAHSIFSQLYRERMLFNGLIPRWARFTAGPAIIMGTTNILLGISGEDKTDSNNKVIRLR